ncbi:MAG: PfkB family carbohydrate kinase [Clostridia bacterium]|nr:PfkB family carbohydrate kinase [Clostridia bacterium]
MNFKKNTVSVIGLCGWSVFLKVNKFNENGETVMADKMHSEVGGKGVNQSVALARLGVNVNYFTVLGDDEEADKCEEYFRREGLKYKTVRKKGVNTDYGSIITDKTGENRVIVYAGASALVTKEDIYSFEKEISESEYLLLQLEFNDDALLAAFDLADKYGVKVILNPAPARTVSTDILKRAYILTPNEQESGILFRSFSPVRAVVTLGAKGSRIIENGTTTDIPAEKVKVKNTTGAGDCFNAGLCYGLLRGGSLKDAARFAVEYSGKKVEAEYVTTEIPFANEIRANGCSFDFIVDDGKSNYKIIIGNLATPPEKYAAEQLARIIKTSTGADILIETDENKIFDANNKYISVGNTALLHGSKIDLTTVNLNYDGFIIKTIGKSVFLAAKEDRAVIYAATEFASKTIGYEYYAADCEKIPELKSVRFKIIDEKFVPDFEGRISFSTEVVNDAENRLFLRNNNQRTGQIPEYGTSGFWSSLTDQSMTMQILNASEYYTKHRNWYYLPDAKKEEAEKILADKVEIKYLDDVWKFVKENIQLCYAELLNSQGVEGGAFETFVSNLINRYIAVEKDKRFFMLGLSDNEYVCECERCVADRKKHTASGSTIKFVNEVAKRVKKWQAENCPEREIYLVVFAYLSTQLPPAKELPNGSFEPICKEVVVEDNVVIRLAPMLSDHYYPFTDKEHNVVSYAMFNGWKSVAKRFAVWDYSFAFYCGIVPLPTYRAIKRNYVDYKNMGVIDVLSQSAVPYNDRGFGRLDDYVRSKLLWNTRLNETVLTDDFIDNYYGEAADYIREYYGLYKKEFDTFMNENPNFKCGIYDNLLTRGIWSKQTLIKMNAVIDNAYKNLKGVCDKVKERIDTESQFCRFALVYLYGDELPDSERDKLIDEYVCIKNKMPYPLKRKTWETCVAELKEKFKNV